MVRVLSCHHFRSQRIGRCDEAVGVAVAGEAVIVALDHQVNIYGRIEHDGRISSEASSPSASNPTPEPGGISGSIFHDGGGGHDIGIPFVYQKLPSGTFDVTHGGRPRTRSGSSSVDSVESDTELRLAHSFSTIDRIDSISYNDKGKYILCLEKREATANCSTSSVRAYFHWEKNHGTKPMRARIAGLVSPTGTEPEEDSLMMVEIPLTSPATAITSCNLSGHIACLSAESIVNMFIFRAKEAAGRMKVHYFDFDRSYAIEMPGCVPEKIFFLTDYVVCMSSQFVNVFRVKKEEHSDSHGPSFIETVNKKNIMSMPTFFAGYKVCPKSSGKDQQPEKLQRNFNKVVFDSKNESVKVHLNTIVRDNRNRRNSPSALITEEFQDEITSNKTKVIFSAKQPGLSVEDMLRVSIVPPTSGNTSSHQAASNNQRFLQVGLYPIRIKDNLGGVALLIATAKEGFLYHLPCKKGAILTRVTSYPLTAPLLSFTFDSLFFHALTETGLESYTCRSLFNAIKDTEGLKTFKNDCPFHEESPSLVGIRPFLKVRYMSCNERNLCLLACPNNPHQNTGKASHSTSLTNEEQLWTIYSLEIPDVDMIYDDIIRTAQLQAETNRESYLTLICEAHTLLRLHMNAHPDSEFVFIHRYRETCKLIGLEYLKSSWINPVSSITSTSGSLSTVDAPITPSSNIPSMSSSSEFSFSEYSSLNISEELVDKGVTYLNMARCDLQEIFSPENANWLREPRYIPGFVRLIEMAFSEIPTDDGNLETHSISPTLAPILVEFLANNGSHVLVDLVIRVPFLRECNSHRLIHILQHLAESKNFHAKETLALLLTLVTVGGVDQPTRSQVKELLHKTKTLDLRSIISREIILEKKGKQFFLTDLAICFADSDSKQLVTNMVVNSLEHGKIAVSDVMLAFAQAVNLNSDTHLQHCITKCMTIILEQYLSDNLLEKEHHINEFRPAVVNKPVASEKPNFTEDEKRAIHALVRTYLSNFNTEVTHNTHTINTTQNNHPKPEVHNINSKEVVSSQVANTGQQQTIHPNTAGPDILQRNMIFGKIPSFINFLINLNVSGGILSMSSQNQSLITSNLFPNEESRENFIKLLSLLTSSLANAEGVKDLILTYLYKNTSQIKPTLHPTFFTILQVLSEPVEKSINIILLKQPTTIMIYAKGKTAEMFGGSTSNWKLLVAHLKKKVQAHPDSVDGDMFATILEGVYLHLANTLTPADLEEVLDKETEDSSKFHGICKKVELANTYANMVITVSSDYLNNK